MKQYEAKLEDYRKKMEEWEALDKELPQIKKEVLADYFLSKFYDAVSKVPDKQMTSGDNDYIYPYEYWDETTTYDTAWKNNERYLEYCRRLGRRPICSTAERVRGSFLFLLSVHTERRK